jgi:arylsulfatase A-like enzyme
MNSTGRSRLLLAILIVSLSSSLLLTCRRRAPADENILLITLDTQRADYLSCYDPNHAQTPNLDALAKEGTLFEHCFSMIPITLPAHAAMFYSQQPHELSVYNNGESFKDQANKTAVAEIFKEQGYVTAAFVSMGVLEEKFGLDQGFGEYIGSYPRNGRYYATAGEINREVFPWLDQNQESKFFLWLHYSDPHAPYHPPYSKPAMAVSLNGKKLGQYYLNETLYELELDLAAGKNVLDVYIENPHRENPKRRHARFRRLEVASADGENKLALEKTAGWIGGSEEDIASCTREATLLVSNPDGLKKAVLRFRGSLGLGHDGTRELYKKEVEYMDRQIGALIDKLKQLGLYSQTHLVIVGDHGEGLGEYLKRNGRYHFGHIQYLYDVYLHVPLLIRQPGKKGGERVKAHVSLLDIAPSLLGLAGLKSPEDYTGSDLLSHKKQASRKIFQATYRPEATRDQFGILLYPLHMIFTPEDNSYELYDLAQDPLEKTDIFTARSQEESVKTMKRQLDEAARAILKKRTIPKIDKSTEEMLKALGYIK